MDTETGTSLENMKAGAWPEQHGMENKKRRQCVMEVFPMGQEDTGEVGRLEHS